MPEFGRALPDVRAWIADGLRAEPGSDAFGIALVLRLIDRASARIGGLDGDGRGATTLRAGDVRVSGRRVRLDYRAKGGVRARKVLTDAGLARALHPGRRTCRARRSRCGSTRMARRTPFGPRPSTRGSRGSRATA